MPIYHLTQSFVYLGLFIQVEDIVLTFLVRQA